MKKSMLILALIITVGSSAVWANNEKDVNDKVLTSFNKEFAAAKNVKWETGGEFIKATFILNDHRVMALFDETGSLLGTARDILFSELPLNVSISVNKEYKNAGVYGIFEVNNADGISYHMMIDTKDRLYKASISPYGNITVLEKSRK